MQKRTIKVAILAALAIILVLAFSGTALADQTWSDLPDTVTAAYGITDNQVAAISQGFAGGLWKPFQSVTRAQFTKMAVAAFKIDLANPATASFSDVPKTSVYYQYIEGAKAAGMINGVAPGLFSPNAAITRQQALAIIARYVSMVNGYDLETMYTDDEVEHLLAHFGDAASISEDLDEEVAFAFDFGITEGNASGNLAPLANLMRIQGAAMLIRAQELIPPNTYIPAEIEMVSADKSENLIGVAHQVTFMVTDATGHPAKGVLVDFDTMFANPLYVGNISPEAAMTDGNGEVTVNLISAEPGTQRVSAAVAGLGAIYTTKYWLALDEVYHVDEDEAQNNVGTPHEFDVRVVVFGPGPRSSGPNDWYNAIDADFDPADINVEDGVDYGDAWDIDFEETIAELGYAPRTMAGIDVEWAILDAVPAVVGPPAVPAVPSVGAITEVDGVDVSARQTAVGHTDADGYSSIEIESTVIGTTAIEAVADYAGNPYPEQLINHAAVDPDDWDHTDNWDDQPTDEALFTKTWIAHTFPPSSTPIAPAYSAPNIGEELTLTITLVDIYGNPVEGRQVEWFMQGVGFFQTDDEDDISDQTGPGSMDFDTTDADGQATVFVKSYNAGEQIVHAKVRDKGTGGAEGTFVTYSAEVQWFDVNVATFDNPATADNEAFSENPVGEDHTFNIWVYGLKLEYDPTLDDPAGQTPYIDGDMAGSAYDGIFDWKDAAYFGGILLVNVADIEQEFGVYVEVDEDDIVTGLFEDPAFTIPAEPIVEVAGRDIILSLVGGYTEYDYLTIEGDVAVPDEDEDFAGVTGIYLPLEGKDITFEKDDSFEPNVGEVDVDEDVTDAAGMATTEVSSDEKGPEIIEAYVDWAGNPHNGPELLEAEAYKGWIAGTIAGVEDLDIEIWAEDGSGELVLVADSDGEVADVTIPAWDADLALGSTNVQVHVKDEFGNDLADYEVVYLLNSIGSLLDAPGQGAVDTYLPLAYLADLEQEDEPADFEVDQNGTAPDADEPTPESDPFTYIVGDGGTFSFFFNQSLGPDDELSQLTAGQPGLPKWPLGRVHGPDLALYTMLYADYEAIQANDPNFLIAPWDVSSLDGVVDVDPENVLLATDGAKAWTLNGWINVGAETAVELQQNELTGSNIDIQLADDLSEFEGVALDADTHFKSILRVMIYAPADGLVQEGTPIYSTQVHVVWEVPVATSIVLSPDSQIKIAGLEGATINGVIYDQFGNPMPNVEFAVTQEVLEGTLSGTFTVDPVGIALDGVTDANGEFTILSDGHTGLGDFGVESFVANVGDLDSNAALVDWVLNDSAGDYVQALGGTATVQIIAPPFAGWAGKTASVFLNPLGSSIGSASVAAAVTTNITVSHTWALDPTGEPFFVHFTPAVNDDDIPNWVYGLALP